MLGPQAIFTKNSLELNHLLLETQTYLQNKYDEREKYQTDTINIIAGEEILRRETLKEIKRAENKITMTLRFILPDEIEVLIKELKLSKLKGISVRLFIFPELFQSLDTEIKKQLREKIGSIRLAPVPIRAIVVDEHQVLMSFLSI